MIGALEALLASNGVISGRAYLSAGSRLLNPDSTGHLRIATGSELLMAYPDDESSKDDMIDNHSNPSERMIPANTALTLCPVHSDAHRDLDDVQRRPTLADSLVTLPPSTEQVRDFFEQYRCQQNMSIRQLTKRLSEVDAEIDASGTYRHTPEELTAGAKLAWRNHSRCIGKLYWRTLCVRDCRHLASPIEIRNACLDHLAWAGNGGAIRPLVSVFAPDTPAGRGPRVRNRQLVAYAGYRQVDGSVLGDAASIPLTDLAQSLGWSAGTPGRFDLLPLVIEASDGSLSAHPLPRPVAGEVTIEHPTIAGLSELGLRWYAFPTVSDMALSIGGITYPLAPFSGWYIAPEISARDFTDPHRYNLLPQVAAAIGLDTGVPRSLWQDRAMIELTAAVLWSYERAGVRIDDHHTASIRFHRYTLAERRRGRDVNADWAWIVPPLSGSATPTFHQSYTATQRWPDFVRPAGPLVEFPWRLPRPQRGASG